MISNRVLRAIVTIAAIGWGAKVLSGKRRAAPVYPGDATPVIPPSETRSPS